MNKWIAVTFFTILTCHLGGALRCYVCDYGTCTFPPKNVTCKENEVCMTEKANTGKLYLKKKSCSLLTNCDQDSEITYIGIKVTTTPSCCFTDLCNSAGVPSVSILTAIAIVISLWMATL
ncbi:prostate stem cell antigen-like [Leptodactylus fuscus]|uniref:prostate stem cell antigen-like n=1 Tax=Leptodactylus fuscus TaxID=238119 RepID=UPI003F4F0555